VTHLPSLLTSGETETPTQRLPSRRTCSARQRVLALHVLIFGSTGLHAPMPSCPSSCNLLVLALCFALPPPFSKCLSFARLSSLTYLLNSSVTLFFCRVPIKTDVNALSFICFATVFAFARCRSNHGRFTASRSTKRIKKRIKSIWCAIEPTIVRLIRPIRFGYTFTDNWSEFLAFEGQSGMSNGATQVKCCRTTEVFDEAKQEHRSIVVILNRLQVQVSTHTHSPLKCF
jgi:hypothetical protein